MKPRRVLVVSGDPASRKHIRDNLYLSGYAVMEAGSRREALGVAEDFIPHAILVQLDVSTVDLGLLESLASSRFSPAVVAITGSVPGTRPAEAKLAGAVDYAETPTCIAELVVRVDRALGRNLPVKRHIEGDPRKWSAGWGATRRGGQSVTSGARSGDGARTGRTVAGRGGSGGEHLRLADLVDGDEPLAMVWATFHGLEGISAVGVDAHPLVAGVFERRLNEHVACAEIYWAGSERLAAVADKIDSPGDTAVALKEAVSEDVRELGLPGDVRIKISAGSRYWGEGKASFIAKVTGRISHGSLPVSPVSEGPAAATGINAERARIDRNAARQALAKMLAERKATD